MLDRPKDLGALLVRVGEALLGLTTFSGGESAAGTEIGEVWLEFEKTFDNIRRAVGLLFEAVEVCVLVRVNPAFFMYAACGGEMLFWLLAVACSLG